MSAWFYMVRGAVKTAEWSGHCASEALHCHSLNLMPEHNYILKIQHLQKEGKLPGPGLWQFEVQHDDWCAIHKDQTCNCDPDIYAYPATDPSARKKIE